MPIGRQTLSVIRPGAQTWVDGVAVRAPESTLSVRATVQPLDSWRRSLLPDGLQGLEFRLAICDSALRSASTELGIEPDLIEFEGRRWQVHQVDPWPTGLIRQWGALIYAREPGAAAGTGGAP